MRKIQKVALVAAMLGSIGFAGAGTAFAGEHGGDSFQVSQSTECKSHDLNLDVLGEVGILNGLLGNGLNGEGNPGAQSTKLGSEMNCSNTAF
ncbi:hypothetical protein NMG29_02380 [Streptomyces cocklensis]|jgi:hypothetical protein|uniref:Secreted protein n=1 Tax=Actinacidiphila cocklensis TaxID=887465 RepID=A0A9W4DSC8_9ACTN|nr:hypothetical protein [Actinacidiphila cocklensis]MDD1057084.1 hypothetical protein [Actinacidiphila cocklensis]WSX78250.1 hypothetical protein OH826_33055 [Streptomyces sp. NBC_00899]CAG6395186.1 conserved exported hypothetical protein [Actinacidiphila cocklensis]